MALFSVLFSYGCISAQQLDLSVDKDSIGLNETITVTVTGEIKDVSAFAELPETDGFVLAGRTENYSYNGNNGKIKLSQSFTLQPLKTGKFSIGPAWAQSGSKRFFSNKVWVTVEGGEASSSSSKAVFLKCEPNKKKVLLGEQVTLTLRLYRRADVNVSQGSDRPYAKAFNGFWYNAGPVDEIYDDTTVTINGTRYIGETIYREFVFPNSTGTLKIPSYEYSCSVKQNPYPTGDALIDDMMGIDTPVELHSTEVPLEVSALPDENRPTDFSGDVGQYSLAATINQTDVKANEAVKLTVTISGKGNVSFIQLPAQKFPDGIESYPQSATDSTDVNASGLEGNKTFTITLIPKKEGKYTIPGITFSYFDPDKKEFVSLHTAEFKLNVAPGDVQNNVSENNLPGGFLTETKTGFTFYKFLKILFSLGLFSIVLVLFLKRRKRIKLEEKNKQLKKEAEENENRKTRADAIKNLPSNAMMPLLERFTVSGNYVAAISKLYVELQNACSKKCELLPEESSVHQIKYRLKVKKYSEEFIDETIQLLEELSQLRYTPSQLNHGLLVEKIQKTRSTLIEMGF
jgi:hypothetical protein